MSLSTVVSLPLWSQFLIDIAVWGLWLGSGCLAATAAELLNRRALPHALLGLCLPYIYPFCLIRYSRGKTAKEEQKRQQLEIQQHAEEKEKISSRFRAMQEKRNQDRIERIAEQQNISVAEAAARQEAIQALRETAEPVTAAEPVEQQAAPAVSGTNEIYQLLFILPVAEDGGRPGPFQFMLSSGEAIDVAGIRELHPDFMVCTLYGTGKSVRLKYTQVESVARYATE